MDLISLALRYVGRHVRLSVHGHQKIEGTLEGVHDDCFRICGALTLDELDDQGWYSKLRESDPDFGYGPRDPEILVHIQSVLAITCVDDEGLEPPHESPTHEQLRTASPRVADILVVSDDDPVGEVDEDTWRQLLDVDRITLEIGPALVGLAKEEGSNGLLHNITNGRKELARQIGLVVPQVRVRDNLNLAVEEYRVCISGCEVARSNVRPDKRMALGGQDSDFHIDGELASDPVFGLPAYWIEPSERRAAELAGWSVFEPQTVIVTHLLDVMRRNAPDLLAYEQVAELVRRFRLVAPQLVHEVAPAVVSLRTLHAILRRLLEERVSIRNFAGILECLGQEAGERPDDVEHLLAKTRIRLGREVCRPLRNSSGTIQVIDLSNEISLCVRNGLRDERAADWLTPFSVHARERWLEFKVDQSEPAILVDADLRTGVQQLLNCHAPLIHVIACNEIPREQQVAIIATISSDTLAAAMAKRSRERDVARVRSSNP